ncbi:MAG: manganese/iron superoxide dismutase-like protein superoxide dismutase, Fe-Mn family [Parcubacteria group bacterium]|nr:manganese/iron superoxide dismutase-like protein superoxide dismutase, Fe-Mn family [Parcubacteria group bacterium]
MKIFEETKFNIPELKGISAKSVEEHLKLYSGYVKNANTILQKIDEYAKDSEANAYALGELQRRFGFEFDGMRNHEIYFSHFEGAPTALSASGSLYKKIEEEFGSFDGWLARFKSIALTRGVGWAVLYVDPKTDRLLNAWIDEQHLGHLTGLSPVLMLDVWEHSFVLDYLPSGKKNYVEDFFVNLNWQTAEANFANAKR